MPIHEASYLSWEGSLLERPRTWLVIARTGVQLAWKKTVAGLLFASCIPFLIRAVQIYLASQILKEGDLAVDASLFMDFMRNQILILLIILAYCGAGLVANDRRFKALPLYFSRPVGFWDYVIGKLLVVFFYGGIVTVVPGLALFVMQLFLTDDAGFFASYYWVPLSIIAQGLLVLTVLGTAMLALSALAKGVRSAIVAFFAVLVIPAFLVELFQQFRDIGWIAITRNLRQISELLYGMGAPYRYPVWAGILSALVVVGAALAVLRFRIKPTEVVK
jgi:ABC-2 type transport system permease protein